MIDAILNPDLSFLLGLLDAAIKAAALLLIAWAITALMQRGSAGARHMVWTFAVGATLLLPVTSVIFPAYRLSLLPVQPVAPSHAIDWPTVPVAISTVAASPAIDRIPERPTASDDRDLFKSVSVPPSVEKSSPVIRHFISRASSVLLIWLTGAGVVGCYCIIGIFVAARLTRRGRVVRDGVIFDAAQSLCEILKVRRHVGVRISRRVLTPLTAGVIRPTLLLPITATDWPQQQLRSVLLHELAHIKRFDRGTQCLAQLACALYWFNPLIWLAAGRMRIEQERACDDLVLSSGVAPTIYADHLVAIAAVVRGRSLFRAETFGGGTIAMARSSDLRGRVTNILNDKVDRRVSSRRLMLVVVAVTIIALVGVSVVRLSAQTTSPAAATQSPIAAAATSPSEEALPAHIPAKRFALRVVGPSGNAVPIDEIKEILVWMSNDMPWSMGPQPPVLAHFAGGWVYTDASMFTLAKSDQRVEMTFVSGHHAMHVQGIYPSGAKELTFQSPAAAGETSIDESTGPDIGTDVIAGRVVDPQGKPVAGAVFSEIEPEADRKAFQKALGASFTTATTDTDGVFRVADLHERNFIYFEVRADGYATRWIGDLPVKKGFTVHLANNTRLRGSLTLPDGKPAAGATMEIDTKKYTLRDHYTVFNFNVDATADTSGRYDVMLEPGIYDVLIKSPTGATARHNGIVVSSGSAVALPPELQEGAKLTIHAVDSVTGKPIAGVEFAMHKEVNFFDSPISGTSRTSDEQGVAHWDGLVAGDTRIGVKADGYARWWLKDDKEDSRGIDELRVDLSPTSSDVTVELQRGIHVQGQVLGPDGSPMGDVMVNVAGMRTGDSRYEYSTDAQGRFEMMLPRIPRFGGDPQWISYAIVACDPTRRLANGISPMFLPAPGSSQNLTIHMTPGAHVRGRVIDGNGKPVAHIEVEAVNQDMMDADYYNPRNVTDGDGRFELPPLRPGDYQFFPDTSFGVNINVPPGYKPTTVHVSEGQALELPDIVYNGPPPGPVPPNYQTVQVFRRPWKRATTQAR